MLTLLKKFFGVGDKPTVEASYKVETPAPKVESLPAGIEAVVVAQGAVVPESIKAEVAPKAPTKPRAPAKPKAEPKPKAPRKPVAK